MRKAHILKRYVNCLARNSIGDDMGNILSILDLQGITWLAGVCAVIVTTLIQNLSSKYKPWTWLAEQFGKAVNKEMLDRLDNVEKKINNIEERDLEQDKKSEEERAKAARRRILRCADEIRSKVKHSKEYFDDVLSDISFYKNYCKDNPKFENEKAVMAIELIEETYKKCCRENDFL